MNEPVPRAVFPADADELTPTVLGAVLAERHLDVSVEHVEVVASKRCGDGVASTADRLVLDLTYGPGSAAGGTGSAAGLPRRMVLKTMLATPHAPAAMYENEVRFYPPPRSTSVAPPRCGAW